MAESRWMTPSRELAAHRSNELLATTRKHRIRCDYGDAVPLALPDDLRQGGQDDLLERGP